MSIRDIKREARKKYKLNQENMFAVSFIYLGVMLVSLFLSTDLMPYISYVCWLLCFYFMGPIDIGKANLCLQTVSINSGCSSDLFRYFDDEGYKKCKWVYFYKYSLVSLLFFGFCSSLIISFIWIVKGSDLSNKWIGLSAYSYALMAALIIAFIFGFVIALAKYIFYEYIIAEKCEDEDVKFYSSDELTEYVKNRSDLLLSGNFISVVKLILSFWWEFLLSLLTFGLGFIILIPYFNTVIALLYVQERDKYTDIMSK